MTNAKFQDHQTSNSEEEDYEMFYHILAWRPFWSCDLDHFINSCLPSPRWLHMKIGLDWPKSLTENEIMVRYMYIAAGQGADEPPGSHKPSVNFGHMLRSFSKNDFVAVFLI